MATRCMQCVRLTTIIHQFVCPMKYISKNKYCSAAKVLPDVLISTANSFSGDRSTLFESEDVQDILKKLTGLNLDKVFEARKENLKNPMYEVLDENDLQKDEEKAVACAKQLLKMPLVMGKRKPIKVILSEDPDIINHDEDGANFVFADISTSKDERTRAVLVRENDTGILREGTWDERDRMQFMYWPREGQKHEVVALLKDEHLPRVFDQLRHEDILDFINIQCLPDSPDYIRVHEHVYDDLGQRQIYHLLDSTRHYGGMVFYYVTKNRTKQLLGYYLRNERFSDAIDLVKLHKIVNSDSEVAQALDISQGSDLLKHYLKSEGLHDLLSLLENKA